jgi:hypothetical protein
MLFSKVVVMFLISIMLLMKEVSTERTSEFNALFRREYADTIVLNTYAPSSTPSDAPSVPPSQETEVPTIEPSEISSEMPTYEPSEISSETPTFEPSEISSETPTFEPSEISSETPSFEPSEISSEIPTFEPSEIFSETPTFEPSEISTSEPTFSPSRSPSSTPSIRPSGKPSSVPRAYPTSSPSTTPTLVPIAHPSMIPSSHPSLAPSAEPSLVPVARPSTIPSVRPSSTPSTKPTVVPIARPSTIPSAHPSSTPAAEPSLVPVARPSSVPSAHPSSTPSAEPVAGPSSVPSAHPSSTPSAEPVAGPSTIPSDHPSSSPYAKPTVVPNALPSTIPSDHPSSTPSAEPVARPSTIPSAHPSSSPYAKPTVVPNALPSTVPSAHPSSTPSAEPVAGPSTIPSAHPSSTPSAEPVARPSTIPSAHPSSSPYAKPTIVPIALPSEIPVSLPTSTPSTAPSSYPSELPSVSPSYLPRSFPSCFPSGAPISLPSLVPSSVPLSRPTSLPSSIPEFNLTSFFFTHPPNITSIDLYHTLLVGSTSNAEVAVVLSNSFGGTVYCLASQSSLLQLSSISSTDIIYSQGTKQIAHSDVVIVPFSNLVPSTNYTVLCSTKSLSGVSLSLPLTLAHNAKFETSCCKTISLSLSFLSVYEFSNILNAVNIKVSSSPSSTLKAELLLISESSNSSSSVVVTSKLYPTQFSLTSSTSSSSALTSTFSAGTPGNYKILLSISGSSSREYSITYATSNFVKVISTLTEPPTPLLQSATFSNDGSYIIVTFDQPTNMGGYSNSFPCSSLFSFLGISSSSCFWKDTSTINIYQSSSSTASSLDIGKNITLLSTSILKAYCPSSTNSQLCLTWKTISGKTVKIIAPSSVIAPLISISAPTVLAPCQSFTMDLTSSSGNAGRAWKSTIFTVSQSPKISSIQPLYNYLVKNYTYSPPGIIPSSLLSRGTTYTIGVTLCNFLQACSTKSTSITIIKNETLIPVVSIKGSTSISTYRSYPLSIKSKAYTESCTGETSVSHLKYSWKLTFLSALTINSNNITEGVMKQVTSSSQNPAYFSLAGYTLPSGAVYQLVLSVTSTISNEVSTSSPVIITVQQGALIALINGGSNKIIQTNTISTIDGSSSYDQDVNGLTGSSAGFSYSWDCYQLKPIFQSNCSNTLVFIGSITSQKLQISPVNDLAINSTSQITMTIFDNSRSASATLSIFITTKEINYIMITTSQQQLTSISTSNNVIVSSTMKIVSPCTAIWSINDASLTLASIAGTSIQQSFKVGSSFQPFNLLIKADTLPQRASLLLSLTCGLGTSSIQLTTNGAPLPGSFSSNPLFGDELSTSFTLFADSWSDSDLPITYQFGFISPSTGSKMVVLGRSSSISTSTTLPAGHEALQFAVRCSLQVYDVFNASTITSLTVAVHPISAAQQQTQLTNLLASSTSSTLDVDSQKALISVVSSVINRINCTVPTNCTTLHRSGCLSTPNTCGSCLSGYTGDSGDRNTKCVDLLSFSAPSLSSTVCIVDSNCSNSLQTCNNATCVYSPKTCLNDCSGNGNCLFRSVSTGDSVSDCRLNDASCESFCHCFDGFYDSSCSLNDAELIAIQAVRSALVNSLQNLTQSDDINSESVSSWADYLSAISNNPYEIPESDLITVGNIALTTMTAAETLGLVWSKVAGLLDALDGITTVSDDYNDKRRRRRRLDTSSSTSSGNDNNVASNLVAVLSKFANIVSNNKVYGDNDESYIKTNFRILSSSSLFSNNNNDGNGNITISVASTDLENLLQLSKSSLTLLPNLNSSLLSNAFVTSLIQTYQKSYSSSSSSSSNFSSSFYSNPIRLQLKSSSIASNEFSSFLLSGIYVTLQHTSSVDSFLFGNSTKSNFTTICKGDGEEKIENHICSYSNKAIQHHCNGTFIGTLVTICPMIQPSCNNLNVFTSTISTTNCQVMNYTSTTTVCFCEFSTSSSNHSISSFSSSSRRSLVSSDSTATAILDETGTATLVAATTYLGEDFYSTFSSADALNESDGFEKSIVVAVLIMIIWGGGFCLLFFIHYREISLIKSNEKYLKLLDMKKEYQKMMRNDSGGDEQTELASLMKEQILSYIDMIMPAVYNTKESFIQRSFRELGLHHRYFHLFVPDTRRANLYDRFYRTMKILSIQTLTMFLQALLFDLQNPTDDGTCLTFHNESSCLSRKTIFDSDQTYCSWNTDNEKCSYANPSFSEIAVIYVMIITAVCTTFFKVPLDQLLKIWICPVAPDGKKMNTAVVPSVETPTNGSPLNDGKNDEKSTTPVSRFLSSDSNSHRKGAAMILSTATGKDGTLIQPGNHLDRLKEDRAIPFEVMIAQEKTIQNLSLIDEYLNKMNNNVKKDEEGGLTLNDIRGGNGGNSFIDPLSSLKGHNAASTSMYHIRSFYSLPDVKPEEGEGDAVRGNNHDDQQLIYQVPSNDLERSIEGGHRLGGHNGTSHTEEREASAINLLINSFCSDILQYKVELIRKNMKTTNTTVSIKKIELFNEQWGMYPSTDLSDIVIKPYKECFLPGVLTTFSTVFQSNLKYFQQISSIFLLLNNTSCGLELMHYFIIDLLGQSTKAALIFRNKFNEDFEKLKIVNKYLKYAAIAIVFGLNGFFIYYMLLRAVYKGYSWQMQYLKVVITQLIIEIFLFESIEVIWLHLITPESVKPEVKKVIYILELLAKNIEKLLLSSSLIKKMEEPMKNKVNPSSSSPSPSPSSTLSPNHFDSTSYLFISKQLSELRPDLIESKIIQTYHNSFPGNICHLWPHYRKILKEKKYRSRLGSGGISSSSPSSSPVNRDGKTSQKSVLSSNSADTIEREGGEGISSSKINRLFNGGASSSLRNHGNFLFIMISSIASGILFTLQNFGILPFIYQRFIIRIAQTSFLSGLTLIWYTAMKHKAYFGLFVVIVFLFLCFMIIRSYFLKSSESTISNLMKSATFLRNASYKLRNSSKSGYQSRSRKNGNEEIEGEGYPFAVDSSSQSEDVYDFESIDLNELDKRIQGNDRIKPSDEAVLNQPDEIGLTIDPFMFNNEDVIEGQQQQQRGREEEKEEGGRDMREEITNDFDDVLLNGEIDDLISSNILSQQEKLLMNLRSSRSSKKGNANKNSQQQRQIILPKQLSGPLSPLNQPGSPFSDYSPVNSLSVDQPLVERNTDAFIDHSFIYPDKEEEIPSYPVIRHESPLQLPTATAKEEDLRPMSSPAPVVPPSRSSASKKYEKEEEEEGDISSPYSQRLPDSPISQKDRSRTIVKDDMDINPMKRSSPLYQRTNLYKIPNENKEEGKQGFKLTKFPFSPANSLNIEISENFEDGKKEDALLDSDDDDLHIPGGRLLNASKKQAEGEGDVSDSSSNSSDSYGLAGKSLLDNDSIVATEGENTNERSEHADSPVVTRHSKKRDSPLYKKSQLQRGSSENVEVSGGDNNGKKKISFNLPKKTSSLGASASHIILPPIGASLLHSYSEEMFSHAPLRALETHDHSDADSEQPASTIPTARKEENI